MRTPLLLLCAIVAALGQEPDTQGIYRIENGITAPIPTHKPDPKMTPQARQYCLDGTILMSLVIDSNGSVRDASVLTPFGFGMDEESLAAVKTWRFKPAKRNNIPVPVQVNAEIAFHMRDNKDCDMEQVAIALRDLQDPEKAAGARESILRLSAKKFPAAQFIHGLWLLEGAHSLPADPALGRELVAAAAKNSYGPALYYVGEPQIHSSNPSTQAEGWARLEQAAKYGSPPAQLAVGNRLENGEGTPMDAARALSFYWMCARSGAKECQFRAGRLSSFNLGLRAYSIAWLELAEQQGVAEAKDWLAKIVPLTPQAVLDNARAVKTHLVRPVF